MKHFECTMVAGDRRTNREANNFFVGVLFTAELHNKPVKLIKFMNVYDDDE